MGNSKHTPKQIVSTLVLFVILSFGWNADAYSQRIEYIYDNAGNRETRQLQIRAGCWASWWGSVWPVWPVPSLEA